MNQAMIRTALLLAGVGLTLGQGVQAAQPKEGDSVYRWGRWAVLSPAAGGNEPFVAANMPATQYNPLPCDAGFCPEVTLQPETPPPTDDPRDRLPPPPQVVTDDPRDRLPPR